MGWLENDWAYIIWGVSPVSSPVAMLSHHGKFNNWFSYCCPTFLFTFQITGMTCSSCVHSIESSMKKRPGILEASVSLATSSGRFVYDTETTGPRDIIEAIKSLLWKTNFFALNVRVSPFTKCLFIYSFTLTYKQATSTNSALYFEKHGLGQLFGILNKLVTRHNKFA